MTSFVNSPFYIDIVLHQWKKTSQDLWTEFQIFRHQDFRKDIKDYPIHVFLLVSMHLINIYGHIPMMYYLFQPLKSLYMVTGHKLTNRQHCTGCQVTIVTEMVLLPVNNTISYITVKLKPLLLIIIKFKNHDIFNSLSDQKSVV